MSKMIKWASTVSVLAASLFLWSCDNIGNSTTPELGPDPMVVMSTSGKRYVVAVERDPDAGSVSATIGAAGGVLVLGKHSLWVSKDAVSGPTTFRMARDPEHPLRVKLSAGQDGENDIGSQGFAAPVKLALSFDKATDLPADKSTLTLLYFRADGLVEELDTRVDVYGLTAVAELPHFSLFGLGWP